MEQCKNVEGCCGCLGRHTKSSFNASVQDAARRLDFAALPGWKTSDVARFWSNVEIGTESDCWRWTGSVRNKRGYGSFSFRYWQFLASRASWAIANGPIPTGMLILHHCDNPPCVNPAHLYLGTAEDNRRDAVERERYKGKGQADWRKSLTHCRHGHEYTPDNVRIERKGSRRCLTCERARHLQHTADVYLRAAEVLGYVQPAKVPKVEQ
jgi:hypothetical protein